VRLATRHRAGARVVACMALRPEYQIAAEHRLLGSTIGALRDLDLVKPGRGVVIEGVPDLPALRDAGLGPYLQPPSR